MYELTKIEEVDEALEKMVVYVKSNDKLMEQLKSAEDYKERWIALEENIRRNLEKFNLNAIQFDYLWIREMFFLKMQNDTKMDFGFCEYFDSGYRNLAESVINEHQGIKKDIDLEHYCSFDNEIVPTICTGTMKEECVFLHPELKKERENLLRTLGTLVWEMTIKK